MSLFGKMFDKNKKETSGSERIYPLEEGLSAFFTQDHRNCDLDWADLEALLQRGDQEAIEAKWKEFDQAMRRHFDMEERELFPLFERVTGMMGGGPTFVMRMEHDQMRGILDDMSTLMVEGNFDEVRNQGDTLLMLIQQHNVKEEGMLYPMSEQRLKNEWPTMKEKLKTYVLSSK